MEQRIESLEKRVSDLEKRVAAGTTTTEINFDDDFAKEVIKSINELQSKSGSRKLVI